MHSSWVPSSGLIDCLNAAFDKLAPAPIHHLALGADKTAPRVLIHDDLSRPDLCLEPVHHRLSGETVSGLKIESALSGPAQEPSRDCEPDSHSKPGPRLSEVRRDFSCCGHLPSHPVFLEHPQRTRGAFLIGRASFSKLADTHHLGQYPQESGMHAIPSHAIAVGIMLFHSCRERRVHYSV